jgi:hypothetical protein
MDGLKGFAATLDVKAHRIHDGLCALHRQRERGFVSDIRIDRSDVSDLFAARCGRYRTGVANCCTHGQAFSRKALDDLSPEEPRSAEYRDQAMPPLVHSSASLVTHS